MGIETNDDDQNVYGSLIVTIVLAVICFLSSGIINFHKSIISVINMIY
jgi:hypothetical protein